MEGGSVLEATGASPAAFKATAARIERLELVLDELKRVERRARREGDTATLDLLQFATPAAARRLDDLKLRGEQIEQYMGFDPHFVHSTPVTASHKQFRMLLKLLGPSKPRRGGRARSRSSGSGSSSATSDTTGSSSSSERRGGRRRRRGQRRRGGRSRRRRRSSSGSGGGGSPAAVPYYQHPPQHQQQHPYAQGPPLAYAYPPPPPQTSERRSSSHGRRRRRRSEPPPPPPHSYPHPHVGATLPPGAYYPYAQQAPAGHIFPPHAMAQQPAHADPSLYAAGAAPGYAAPLQQPVHFSPAAAPAAATAASLASVSPAPSGRLAPPAGDALVRLDPANAAQEAAEAAATAAAAPAAAPAAAKAAAAPDVVADFSASVSARPPQDGAKGVPAQVVETTENAACEYVSKLSHEAALRCVHSLLQHVRETGSGGGSSLDDYLIAGGDSDRKWRDRRRVLQTVVTMPQTCQQLLGSTQLASVPLGLKGWACLEVLRFYNGGTGLAHPYDGRFKAVLCSPSPANQAALETGVRGRVAALGLDGPSAELLHVVLDHLHDACYASAPSPAQAEQHRQLCTLFARALAPHLLGEQDVHEPAQALAASPDVSGLAAALHTLSCERTPLGFVFQHRDDTAGGGDGEADADRRSSIRSTGGAAAAAAGGGGSALGRRSARGGFGGGRGGGGARSSRIIGALSSVAASVGDDFGGDFGGGSDLMTGFGGSVSVRPFGASRTTPRTARGSVAVSAPASQSGDAHHQTPDSKPSKAPRDIDSEFDHY